MLRILLLVVDNGSNNANKKEYFGCFYRPRTPPSNSMERWTKAAILAGFALGIIGALTLVELRKTRMFGKKQIEMNKEASDRLIAIKEVKFGLRTSDQYNIKYPKDEIIDRK